MTPVTADGAGCLAQVVDSATGLMEQYAWNADGTLASYPGPGYTRRLGYDDEGRLTGISRDYGGGNVQAAYQYGYGADGGRRWRKDLANNVWTWYPCGVACCAGGLVETQSDLTGNSWSASAQYLQGLRSVRRNGEYLHPSIAGVDPVVTNSSGAVTASNLYDAFGSSRYTQGTMQSQWISEVIYNDAESLDKDGNTLLLLNRAVAAGQQIPASPLQPYGSPKPKPIPNPPGVPPVVHPLPPLPPGSPPGLKVCNTAFQVGYCVGDCAAHHQPYIGCYVSNGHILCACLKKVPVRPVSPNPVA